MTISQTRANYGLLATVTPTSPNSSGSLNVGVASGNANLSLVNTVYSVQALVAGAASDLVINLATGSKSGSTAWTAGSAQVETATVVAASGATTGTLAVVVTSSGMTGSPLTVNVSLVAATHTTAALIAQAIVDALNANTVVAARFTASRSTAAVLLTRKPTATYTVGSVSVPVYLVGDASEFTIPTALGITGATSTTGAGAAAGVASAGCYVVGDGEDFEGNAFTAIGANKIGGLYFSNSSVSPSALEILGSKYSVVSLPIGGSVQFVSALSTLQTDALTITPTSSTALVTIVVAGTI